MRKKSNVQIMVATVFANLLHQNFSINSNDEKLVIEAIQRSNNELENASLTEIADYLQSMDKEQLKGLENNIKGIYHELKYVDLINQQDNGLSAKVFSDTNHEGTDVILTDESGNIVKEVQLKATDSTSYINEHLQKNPNIEVMATSEIAEKIDNINSTGISNTEITEFIQDNFENIGDNFSTVSQTVDAVESSAFMSSIVQASQVLTGKKEIDEAGKDMLVNVGTSVGASVLVSLLLS